MVDFGFKKIFKDSGKKQLIIRPLNAIFGLDIADIDIRESEQLGLTSPTSWSAPSSTPHALSRRKGSLGSGTTTSSPCSSWGLGKEPGAIS